MLGGGGAGAPAAAAGGSAAAAAAAAGGTPPGVLLAPCSSAARAQPDVLITCSIGSQQGAWTGQSCSSRTLQVGTALPPSPQPPSRSLPSPAHCVQTAGSAGTPGRPAEQRKCLAEHHPGWPPSTLMDSINAHHAPLGCQAREFAQHGVALLLCVLAGNTSQAPLRFQCAVRGQYQQVRQFRRGRKRPGPPRLSCRGNIDSSVGGEKFNALSIVTGHFGVPEPAPRALEGGFHYTLPGGWVIPCRAQKPRAPR